MMPYNLFNPMDSSSFKLAESIESNEPMEPLSSESSINSPSETPHHVDDNLILSSTVSHLISTLLTKTASTTPTPPSFSTTTTEGSSSLYTTTTIATPSTASILLSTLKSSSSSTPTLPLSTTLSPTGHHHHYHHHSVTPPIISTLPSNGILDFGDKFLREEQRCVALVPEIYDPLISSLCGLAVTIGLLYILFGYRLFRSVLFLTGFLIISSLTYGFIVSTSTPIPFYGTLIVSLTAGFLAGLVTLLVAWLGLMVLGFHLGTFNGILIIISVHLLAPYIDSLPPPQSMWITFSVIASCGIIGAFSTLYFQKGSTILATCMFGSTLVIGGLDYFVENFNLFLWFWDNLKSNGNAMLMSTAYGIDSESLTSSSASDTTESGLFMCLISWILLMLWVILVSLGLFCQWCATGRGYFHSPSGTFTSTSSSRRNGTLDLVRIRAEESKTDQKQRKYRYLYQVRTAHGDVISQHYIQNFQKKLSPQMDNNDSLRTYNSDLSHLTSYNQSESRTTTMSHLP